MNLLPHRQSIGSLKGINDKSCLRYLRLLCIMSLYIASLNSGSNGNCYYIGNEREAILVDAGISCRETEKRILRLGLAMNKVKAVFVSHEHSDHNFRYPCTG